MVGYGRFMPELPEVETVRRRLAPALEGRLFERVEITDARLTRPDDPFEIARELEGERVTKMDRRGKYLIVRFESGRALLIHLRMTGSLRHARAGELEDDPHRRAVVNLDDGSDVAYRDVRRFGTWLLLEPSDVDTYIDARVGPEPLEDRYKAKHLADKLATRRAPIKAAILDQRTVAGVGNIYADEALWRAQVHPLTPANELSTDEVKAVYKGIRAALQAGVRRQKRAEGRHPLDGGVRRQGSTLRDYQLPDGSSGSAQDRFKVYGRAGKPCERCGTPIDKIRVAGRGTWYCPSCQLYRAQAASSSSRRPSRSRRQSSV